MPGLFVGEKVVIAAFCAGSSGFFELAECFFIGG